MSQHEQEPAREREPLPYYLASQFLNERPAGRCYEKAQEAIYKAPTCDLSVFRLQIPSRHTWLVTVIGQQPDEVLERKLQAILAAGDPTVVPADVLQLLQARRADATKLGPWVEGHYPPQTQH